MHHGTLSTKLFPGRIWLRRTCGCNCWYLQKRLQLPSNGFASVNNQRIFTCFTLSIIICSYIYIIYTKHMNRLYTNHIYNNIWKPSLFKMFYLCFTLPLHHHHPPNFFRMGTSFTGLRCTSDSRNFGIDVTPWDTASSAKFWALVATCRWKRCHDKNDCSPHRLFNSLHGDGDSRKVWGGHKCLYEIEMKLMQLCATV